MAKKKEKKKPIFDKVGLVFRNPVRVDIMKQLSEKVQRPTDIADNIGIQKQNINYHLNALKKGGLVKIHKEELSDTNIQINRGARINGVSEKGTLKVSYGVELTKNGKDLVHQFVNPLYEKPDQKEENNTKNNKLEEKKV